MRKAALLYNPLSGRRPGRRLAEVEAALAVLQAAGIEVSAAATGSAADGTEQTRLAIAQGCDTIFACGGDGTVHDVLQGLVGSHAALGIIPLGTANALAHDLRLPLSPVDAARAALTAEPRRIAVGRLDYRDFSGNPGSRCFTVAVGVGVDAQLFYKLNLSLKGRLGMLAYYAKATHLWLTHRMRFFEVEFLASPDARPRRESVSELLAVRIAQFGGVLRELAPGASLQRNDMRLVLFKTNNRLCYLAYILRGLLGWTWSVPSIELAYADRVKCSAPDVTRKIFVEADGELVGTLPAEISIVPDGFTLLVPRR